jgi:hypothetical protein
MICLDLLLVALLCLVEVSSAQSPNHLIPWQITYFNWYRSRHGYNLLNFTVLDNNTLQVLSDGLNRHLDYPVFPATQVNCVLTWPEPESISGTIWPCDSVSSDAWNFEVLDEPSSWLTLRLNRTETMNYNGTTYYKQFESERSFSGQEFHFGCGASGSCNHQLNPENPPVFITQNMTGCYGYCDYIR